ncbi:aromatic acid exporter family protein [Kineococcus sp. TBRC 1896]|uniref:Aromatic acid exporter family protein n=1 Tax=Kineococcus mangrovi TaxID=1660183 RepID=A0ABV4HXD2_9ACTN
MRQGRARALTFLARRPRVGLALRTALAATLAWIIALALPGAIPGTYPYFAPLGAVVGSYSTVRSSVRNSARAVAAIVCGALLAVATAELLGRDLVVIPVVVFLATLLAGWRLFADQGSWVLTVGLFVLVVGVEHPVQYAVGYTTLTLLGGCVAVAVNTLLPSFPLAQSRDALSALSTTLADQLDDLAEGLRRDEPPGPHEWAERLSSVAPVRESLRRSREETEESLAGNLRARRYVESVREQHVRGVALGNVAVRVEELTELLVEALTPREDEVALPTGLRGPTAETLTALAGLLREEDGTDADRVALREALRRLSGAEAAARFTTDRDRQAAGAVVTALRRCLGALDVRDPEVDAPDEEAFVPTPWVRPDTGGPRPSGSRPGVLGRWRARLRRPRR